MHNEWTLLCLFYEAVKTWFLIRHIFIWMVYDHALGAALTFHNSPHSSEISYQFAFLRPRRFYHQLPGKEQKTPDLQLWLRGYTWIIKVRGFFFSRWCFVLFWKSTHDEKITASTSIQKYISFPLMFLFHRTIREADYQPCFLAAMPPTLSHGCGAWRHYSEGGKKNLKNRSWE